MKLTLSITAVIVGGTGVILWAAWRWARGYDSITRSDHYERRNY